VEEKMSEDLQVEEYEAPELRELGSVAELTQEPGDTGSVVDDSATSDARLKEDVATLAGALARLQRIDLP
jgi:hypothetical protein